ncbi:ATP-binding protein [Limibacter armeniacum]|uniref:ATP-binding protein n=1 Tax=Limibacter armeniacum TaxID=466084 RepID=UPI002FE60EC2
MDETLDEVVYVNNAFSALWRTSADYLKRNPLSWISFSSHATQQFTKAVNSALLNQNKGSITTVFKGEQEVQIEVYAIQHKGHSAKNILIITNLMHTASLPLPQLNQLGIGRWEFSMSSLSLDWTGELFDFLDVPSSKRNSQLEVFQFMEKGTMKRLKQCSLKALKDNTAFSFELKAKTASGNEKWVRIVGESYLKLEGLLWKGYYQDISHEKAMEERLDMVITSTNIGTWEWNLHDKTISCDQRAQYILGIDQEKLTLDELMLILKSTPPWKSAAVQPNGKGTFELRIAHQKKGERLLEGNFLTKPNTGEGPQKILGYVQDITDKREQEQKQEQAMTNIKETSQAKEDFLATVSHELRNPLNAVLGMTYLLMNEPLSTSQLEKLNVLKLSAEQLMGLTNDVLDLNRITSGKVSLEKEPFSIKELFGGIKQGASLKAKEKGVDLNVRLVGTVPELVVGDQVRLKQILDNLVTNAIKFTEQGKVTVEVKVLADHDNTVELLFSVTDTGIGISASQQQQIFERYVQVSEERTHKVGGAGLGLAITKQLVELFEGSIEVESQLGEGTRFDIRLELEKGTVDQDSDDTYSDDILLLTKSLNGVRILVVEDNKMNSLVVTSFLNNWDAEIDYASNGKEALHKIRQKDFDIVLMDLQMPDMDGYQVTEHIKNMEGGSFSNLSVIALTASSWTEVEKRRKSTVGFDDYLQKPFVPEQLYNKLAKYAAHKINKETQKRNGSVKEKTLEMINLQGVLDMSNGEPTFLKHFLDTMPRTLEYFLVDYQHAVQNRNYDKLLKLEKRIRSTIDLLEFHSLDEEIVATKILLQSEHSKTKPLKVIQERVEHICKQVIALLKEESKHF